MFAISVLSLFSSIIGKTFSAFNKSVLCKTACSAIALSTSSIEINSPDRFLYFISADFASNSALFASAIIFFLFASNTSFSVVSFSDSLC